MKNDSKTCPWIYRTSEQPCNFRRGSLIAMNQNKADDVLEVTARSRDQPYRQSSCLWRFGMRIGPRMRERDHRMTGAPDEPGFSALSW
jgi:hypothetical protein